MERPSLLPRHRWAGGDVGDAMEPEVGMDACTEADTAVDGSADVEVDAAAAAG